jgi:hypothetical protein
MKSVGSLDQLVGVRYIHLLQKSLKRKNVNLVFSNKTLLAVINEYLLFQDLQATKNMPKVLVAAAGTTVSISYG